MQIEDWTNLPTATIVKHKDLPFTYSLVAQDHLFRWIAVECDAKQPLRSKILTWGPRRWRVVA